MLKNNIWKFMMPIRRELVKDTLLLLAVTSLEGIRSDSESHWFIASSPSKWRTHFLSYTRVPKRGFGCLELWPTMDYGCHISVVSPLESGWKSPSHEVGGHPVAYRGEDCGGCRTNFLSSQWLGCHAGVQSCCKNHFTTTLQPRLRPLRPQKSEKIPLPSKNANGRHLSGRISQKSIVGQSLFSF